MKGEVKDRMQRALSRRQTGIRRETEKEDGEALQTRPHFQVYLILN